MLYRRGVLQQSITEYSGWVNIQLQDIIKRRIVMEYCAENEIFGHLEGIMNKTLYNGDYIKGMRLLLRESKMQGINIRKARWIPIVSKMLSEHDLCYKFWYYACSQNRIKLLLKCNNWYDLLYNPDVCAFFWSLTDEKNTFWRDKLWTMLGLDDFVDLNWVTKLLSMKL